MSPCEKEFDDSFKGIVFHEGDGAIHVWREAWKKSSIHFAKLLDERANEWCKWNDKRMVSELRMVAEKIRGELHETNK